MIEAPMPRRLPKHCVEDVDRYGNIRIYLRLKGRPKVRLEGIPWSPDFMARYETGLNGPPPEKASDPRVTTPNTWKWLCQAYLASTAFKSGLDGVTQRRRRSLLEATYDEPTAPGAKTRFADFPLARLTSQAIAVLRDRKAAQPDGANNTLKAIRAVFKWALLPEVRKAPHNPARDVPLFRRATDGFHTWSVEEVLQFQRAYPLGTKQALALALLLYVGGRRSDVVKLGRQHLRDGVIRYTQHKNRQKAPMTLEVPVLPELREAIDACPSQHLTFLVTDYGKSFSSNGFGNRFGAWCEKAGLPHCSAHGLRKAGATLAAENGATVSQLMAMFGWRTAKMAELYTKKAEQRRLARCAMSLITLKRDPGPTSVPLSGSGRRRLDNRAKKRLASTPSRGVGAQERTGRSAKINQRKQWRAQPRRGSCVAQLSNTSQHR